jgi:hypothetical protein
MYIKLNNGVIEKYPYSIGDLRKANPQTSFPKNPGNDLLAQWEVFPVHSVSAPFSDYSKNVTEGTPVYDGVWKQTWIVEAASEEQLAERKQSYNDQQKRVRAQAYRDEADPLFFKVQRGEATMEQWLSCIQDIKIRFRDL